MFVRNSKRDREMGKYFKRNSISYNWIYNDTLEHFTHTAIQIFTFKYSSLFFKINKQMMLTQKLLSLEPEEHNSVLPA